MPGKEIERLRALYSCWAEGDFAADADLFAADLVLEPWSSEPRPSYRGADEIGPWLRDYLGRWDDLRVEAVDLLAGERGIVVTERLFGFDRRAGVDTQMRLYAVWRFRGEQVCGVRWGTDRLRAYAAADVRQQSPDWSADYSASAGLPFDDDELESRIVWIWGSPRSGSTWLLRQICHPAVLDRRAPLGFTMPEGASDDLRAVPFDELLVSSHVAPKWGPPISYANFFVPRTLPGFAGDHTTYAFSERYVDVWAGELRRLILVRLAATLDRARLAGAAVAESPLLVIKEVNGTHAATRMMSLFPRSRMLFLIRDGRDVVDSLVQAYRPGGWMASDGPGLDAPEDRASFVREAAMEWACNVDIVRSTLDAHAHGLGYQVRYEDLLEATAPSLTALFDWIGLPSEPGRVAEIVAANSFETIPAQKRGAARVTRAARPGLWRENLSEEEQGVVSEVMGPRLEQLGYEPA